MAPEACRDRAGDLAAAALGRLEPAARTGLEAHVEGCAGCRAELHGLRAVGGLLDRVEWRGAAGADAGAGAAVDGAVGVAPPPDLGTRIETSTRSERVARRMRRGAAVAAGAGVAALAAALFVLAPWSASTEGRTIRFESAADVDAEAVLVERAWGTEIELEASGLEPGDVYWLWITGDDGKRVTAGTFRASAGRARVVAAAALPLHDTRRVWLTDASDAVVLDADLPPPPAG